MMQVRNRAAIANLSRRGLRANGMRNVISVLAIAMTAMMFTSVFTIGISMVKNMEEQTMRQVGLSAPGGFKYLTQAEYDKLTAHPLVTRHDYGIIAGIASGDGFTKLRGEVRFAEENHAKTSFTSPQAGTLPQERLALATSTIVLDALGIPHQLGATVPLEFTARGIAYKQDFTLCGWWEGDTVNMAQMIYLSHQYIDEVAPLHTVSYAQRGDNDFEGTIDASVFFGNNRNIESKLRQIIADSGYTEGDISYGVNWAYLGGGKLDLATVLIAALVLLLISLAGYLIIYNIFYISVAKDTRYYGLLKTIGTTGKQLGSLVRRQALLLSIVGIPLGLLLGWLLGTVLYPMVVGQTILTGSGVAVNMWVFAGSALFALATVWFSCRKPCKLAARVSPIEALRYSEAMPTRKKARRTGKASPARMAWRNVLRSRKQMLTVVASLSLSVILLNSVYSAAQSFDIDKFLSNKILFDFGVAQGRLLTQFELEYLTNEKATTLEDVTGIQRRSNVYMSETGQNPTEQARARMLRYLREEQNVSEPTMSNLTKQLNSLEDNIGSHVFGIDRAVYDKIDFMGAQKPAWETFSSGDYVLAAPFNDETTSSIYDVGDTLQLNDMDGNAKAYQVLAIADIPYPASPMHGHISDTNYLLPQQEYLARFPADTIIHAFMDAQEGQLEAVQQQLASLCEGSTLSYTSRGKYLQEFAGAQQMYLVVGGVLSGILGLLGILNLVNSMATSILTRRRELAMLQSVGMTARQQLGMLVCEGLVYAGLTALLVLTLGSLLTGVLIHAIAGQIWFFTYHFTLLPVLVCLPLMAVVVCIVPLVCYRSTCRDTVVERLREAAE